MKNALLFFLTATFLFSCVNPEKLLTEGRYDEALDASIHKVKKGGKDADKQALIMEEAYKKANQQDKERIEFLKKEDKPSNWDDIYYVYVGFNNRQEKVKPILPVYIRSKKRDADIAIVDYSGELIATKNKAIEYFYTHAILLMEKNTRQDARDAYAELLTVKRLNSDYKDVNDQLKKAKALGTTYILYKVENKAVQSLPSSFEQEMLSLPFAELNKEWLQYDGKIIDKRNYDYTVTAVIKTIDVGPDAVTKNDYTETKQVEDGYNYVLDDKGNVKKDLNGNDMKTPKYKNISCQIIETHQKKKSMLNGTLDYYNIHTSQLIRSELIASESVFENHAAAASGDMNALKPETKAKLGSNLLPFPNGMDMIMKTCPPLKTMVKDLIWKNKDLLN